VCGASALSSAFIKLMRKREMMMMMLHALATAPLCVCGFYLSGSIFLHASRTYMVLLLGKKLFHEMPLE
jgi:hypothetical protein